MKSILKAVNEGRWEDALREFLDYSDNNQLDEEGCILGATVLEQFGEHESMYALIIRGLKMNPQNYELYLLLGNYYSNHNADRAYLSYEQAHFLATRQGKKEDADQIWNLMSSFSELNDLSVRNTTILIIEEENRGHLEECKIGIETTCPAESTSIMVEKADDETGVPGAINRALNEINENDDVLLLYSDVVLMPNALYILKMGLYDGDNTAACSARCNISEVKKLIIEDWKIESIKDMAEYACINSIPEENSFEIRPTLDICFTLISREAINTMTPFRENFTKGEIFGIDMCLTLLDKGFRNKACWNSFVYRYPNKVGYTKQYADRFYEERQLLRGKWGFEATYYVNARIDLVSLIAEPEDSQFSVLEVGCGLGATLTCILSHFPNAKVRGIEIVEAVAAVGGKMADIECANIENYEFDPEEKFDYIIFGDVLEHLIDPYSLIRRLRDQLKDGGCILASIPNIMNAGVVYELLHGNFTYQGSGILDKTHLRFFTLKEIVKMFKERGYVIEVAVSSGSEGNTTDDHPEFWEKILSIDGVSPKDNFDAFQYIFRAKKVNI